MITKINLLVAQANELNNNNNQSILVLANNGMPEITKYNLR